MIGKSSAFTQKDGSNMRPIVAINRSLIPDDGVELPSLTGLTGSPTQLTEHSVSFGMSQKTVIPQESAMTPNSGVSVPSESSLQTINPGSIGEFTAKDQSAQPMRLEQPVIVEIFGDTSAGSRPDQTDQTDHTVTFGFSGHPDAEGEVQKELANACSNVQTSQPMPLICYYYSE
jgi:hypothetical protein